MIRAFILAVALAALSLVWHPAGAQVASPGPAPAPPFVLSGGPKVGRFYTTPITGVPVNTAVASANRLMVQPVYVSAAATLKSLSFDIGTGNAASWNARMCVFADTGAGFPGALEIDSGTVAIGSGSVTGVQTASLNSGNGLPLPGPAMHWVGFMADSASESVFSHNNAVAWLIGDTQIGFSSATALFTNSVGAMVYMAQTFGACPGTFSASPTFGDGVANPTIAMGY